MRQVTYPVYVLRLLGVRTLVITNACGGIDRGLAPGELMLLSDYINMLGSNSLMGPNDERFGPRFPDMTEAYSLRLRALAKSAAAELGIACKEGVYAIFPGPCYETAAEIRAYRRQLPGAGGAGHCLHHQYGHRHRRKKAFPRGGLGCGRPGQRRSVPPGRAGHRKAVNRFML